MVELVSTGASPVANFEASKRSGRSAYSGGKISELIVCREARFSIFSLLEPADESHPVPCSLREGLS